MDGNCEARAGRKTASAASRSAHRTPGARPSAGRRTPGACPEASMRGHEARKARARHRAVVPTPPCHPATRRRRPPAARRRAREARTRMRTASSLGRRSCPEGPTLTRGAEDPGAWAAPSPAMTRSGAAPSGTTPTPAREATATALSLSRSVRPTMATVGSCGVSMPQAHPRRTRARHWRAPPCGHGPGDSTACGYRHAAPAGSRRRFPPAGSARPCASPCRTQGTELGNTAPHTRA